MFQIISILVFAVVALAPVPQEDIIIKKPVHASSLSGTVVDQTGSGIPGVLVKRLGPDKNGDLDEIVTDSKGLFSFSGITQGKHSLKLSKSGWSTMYVTIVIDKKAKRELELMMLIAR